MTKEQLYAKWIFQPSCKDDIESVIATEIAKVQEQPQPALNEIEKAYHNYEPIRYILWKKGWRIKKHSDTESIDANGRIFNNTCFVFNFDTNPEKWELYTEPEKHAPNPIEQAFERGEKIRQKNWLKSCWIKKHSETETIDERGNICYNDWSFVKHPNKWEIYTEPAEQPSSQAKLDNSFDKERFEAMFRAVVANGGHELDHKQAIELTEEALKQLDAYYSSKEGGNNG